MASVDCGKAKTKLISAATKAMIDPYSVMACPFCLLRRFGLDPVRALDESMVNYPKPGDADVICTLQIDLAHQEPSNNGVLPSGNYLCLIDLPVGQAFPLAQRIIATAVGGLVLDLSCT